MTQDEYEKLQHIIRVLRRWKRQGKIANYRVERGTLVMIGIRYPEGSGHSINWMFYSMPGFLKKLKKGEFPS